MGPWSPDRAGNEQEVANSDHSLSAVLTAHDQMTAVTVLDNDDPRGSMFVLDQHGVFMLTDSNGVLTQTLP